MFCLYKEKSKQLKMLEEELKNITAKGIYEAMPTFFISVEPASVVKSILSSNVLLCTIY